MEFMSLFGTLREHLAGTMALDLIKTRNWDSPECALEFSVILTDCMVNSTKIAEN